MPVSSTTPVLGNAGSTSVSDGQTVLRIRGTFLAYLSASNTVTTGGFGGAFGIGKARLSAFNAGIASLPSPIDEEEWDGWLFHKYFFLRTPTATIGDNINDMPGAVRFEIDTKAMRKVDLDDVIYGAIDMGDENGVAIAQWYFNTRMLIALP